MADFKSLAALYKNELLDRVVPFWLEKSQDGECGGYFTCFDREGNVFDTDKFVWLQGRQVWMFATLCRQLGVRKDWLECAVQGAEFLKKHGHDGEFNWYFSLTRDGRPLVAPYNIFSGTFAAMAFAQLSLVTENAEYAEIASKTFGRVIQRVPHPKMAWEKGVPGTRDMKGFALPMILCNLALEMESLLEPAFMQQTVETCIHEVMDVFYRPELGLIVENVGADGTLVDSFDGRLLNPGHALEAMWFIMDLGVRLKRRELIEKAVDVALAEVEYGWDTEHGGIFYFLDRLGRPPQQLEWDQKLWWVHIETLITMLKGYQLTGRAECLEWFQRVHEYTWGHFRDLDFPEWYGYLNRRGEVLLPLKGGKWKGCFHVPRGLLKCWSVLEQLSEQKSRE